MLGYCLTLDSPEALWSFAEILTKRLTATERAAIALVALSSLDNQHAIMTADAAMNSCVAPNCDTTDDHNEEESDSALIH